jgi:hypothetical protein
MVEISMALPTPLISPATVARRRFHDDRFHKNRRNCMAVLEDPVGAGAVVN